MNTQQIIELYRPAIIQIATQTSTGTGFYVKEFDLIITNEHVVGKNAEVTIDDNLGFALPVSYLREALELYQPHRGEASTRCHSCNHLVFAGNIESTKYCPYCGTEVKLPQLPEREAKPVGVAKTVEEILKELGK